MSLEETIAAAVRQVVREELRALVGRPTPDAMSTTQAAELAGVTPKTVRTWVETGVLRAQRRGRRLVILRRDLEAHLAGSPPAAGGILSSLTSRTP